MERMPTKEAVLKIYFQTTGGEQYYKELGLALGHIQDFRPCWNEVTKVMESHEKKTFQNAGSVDGLQKWAPRKRNYPWPILDRTGTLKKSLTTSNAKGAVRVYENKFMIFGSDPFAIPYSVYVHSGTRFMPARPVLQMSGQLATKILKTIQAFVSSWGLKRVGPIA